MKQRIQEISYFIHSRKIGNEMIDVVIPRYMTYVKRYVQTMIEDTLFHYISAPPK